MPPRIKYKGEVLDYIRTITKTIKHENTTSDWDEPEYEYFTENFFVCINSDRKIVEVPASEKVFYSWERTDGTFDETGAEYLKRTMPKPRKF